MDPNYKPIYQRLEKLEYQIKDAVDDDNNSLVRSLQEGVRAAMDDIETSKSPRSVEDRVKTLQQHLSQLREQGDEAMDYRHIDEFHRNFEDIRQELRKLSNY